MTDDSAEILFQSFMRRAVMSSSGMGKNVHAMTLSIQHFLCRPRRRPPSKVNGFGEAVVACSMPEPCECPSLDSCQKSFQWTHEEADLAPHPVVGLVPRVRDAMKFHQALGFERLDPFIRVSKRGPQCFIAIGEEGGR